MKSIYSYLAESIDILDSTVGKLTVENTRLTESDVDKLCKQYNLSNVNISVEMPRRNKSNEYLSIDFIEAKTKNSGAGSVFMTDLCKWADDNNRILCLNPVDIYVGKKNLNRLINFYKKFGFENNEVTSRSKTRKQMIRYTQK